MNIERLYKAYTGAIYFDNSKEQRAYALCLLSCGKMIKKPKGWLKKKCPICKTKLKKYIIEDYISTYICYACPNCDYEWGKYD